MAEKDKKPLSPMIIVLIAVAIILVIGLIYFLLNKDASTPVIVSSPRFDGLTSSFGNRGFVENAFSMFGNA